MYSKVLVTKKEIKISIHTVGFRGAQTCSRRWSNDSSMFSGSNSTIPNGEVRNGVEKSTTLVLLDVMVTGPAAIAAL